MKIKEIKQHTEYDRFLEIKIEGIKDRIFTMNIDRINTLDEFKELLSKKLRGYYRRKELKELEKTYPTKEELKSQINELLGTDIQPKEVN